MNKVTLKSLKTVELSNLSKVSKFTSYFKISSFINTFTIDMFKKLKKAKTKIHITVIRCETTVKPEIKLKEEQLQN